MKKVLLSVTAATFMLIALVGCKGGAANDPKSVAIAFMDAVKAKDFDGAAKYATKDSKSALDMMKSAVKMAEAFGGKSDDMDFDKEWKGKKVEYSEPKIEGDNATLSLMVDGKEQMPISLKKEEGNWKVAFDKSTLMKTGTDKMNMNDINNSMKNIDNMGDSIQNALNDASKMMNTMGDSIKNAMDSAKKMMEEHH